MVKTMKINVTDEQLEIVINKAFNEGYKRGYQDGVQHIKNVVEKQEWMVSDDNDSKTQGENRWKMG